MNFEQIRNRIRTVARDKEVTVQEMYDKYFFDTFLKRLTKSSQKDNFILKGGFLLENVIGIENRTTLDIDFSYQTRIINKDVLKKEIIEIIEVDSQDEIEFEFYDITEIQEEEKYKGYRVRIKAKLRNINKIFQIDIASGDVITPSALNYEYETIITSETFNLLSYNSETIVAEKFQTIINKGTSNTRMKDYYDIYLLVNEDNFNYDLLHSAVINTFTNRDTEYEKEYIGLKIQEVSKSLLIKERYERFEDNSNYEVNANFEDVMKAINKVYKSVQYIEPFKLRTKNIYFIRHGEDNQAIIGGWSNNSLSEKGIKQVEKLKEELITLNNNDKLIALSSDLKRAAETSKTIFGDKTVKYSEKLRECNNGSLKDLSTDEFIENYQHLVFSKMGYNEQYPGGESPKEFHERVVAYIEEVNELYRDNDVVIVSHGGVYSIIEALIKGVKWTNKIIPNINYAEMKIYKNKNSAH